MLVRKEDFNNTVNKDNAKVSLYGRELHQPVRGLEESHFASHCFDNYISDDGCIFR